MARSRVKEERSAGGVVYRMDGGRAVYLLIRDSYRNWGFPKGHLETEEPPELAALREVQEETGLTDLALRGEIETIDWYFRFRGKLIHKVCHFYLMESATAETNPQREEGITACRWATVADAMECISYANARDVLRRAHQLAQGETPGDARPAPSADVELH